MRFFETSATRFRRAPVSRCFRFAARASAHDMGVCAIARAPIARVSTVTRARHGASAQMCREERGDHASRSRRARENRATRARVARVVRAHRRGRLTVPRQGVRQAPFSTALRAVSPREEFEGSSGGRRE
jgi:hypothetical protein